MSKLLKGLQEQKNTKIVAMEEMLTRSAEEFDQDKLEEMKRQVEELNTKIKAVNEASTVMDKETIREINVVDVETKTNEEETRALKEEELFLRAVQGDSGAMEELRAITGQEGLIPTTIAKDIVKYIETISQVYAKIRKFPIPGKLTFVLENDAEEIKVQYVDDEAETPESNPSFKSQTINDFQIRGLVKISRSLLNKSQFDLRGYIIEKISKAYAKFIEKEIFNGTSTAAKILGLVTLPANRKVEVPVSQAEVAVDDLIDLEMLVPTELRSRCEFYINPVMVKKLRKLKYETGEKVLQKDLQSKFKYELLGYPVNESDQVAENMIFFADMSGYYAKEVTNMSIQTLLEKFATQHRNGYHAVAELGGAPIELQKLAMLEHKKS